MKRKWLVLLAGLTFGGLCLGQNTDSAAANREDLSAGVGTHEPPRLGIHWARGFEPFARVRALKGNNPDMTYHGGVILPSTVSEAIFWGPNWAKSSFTGDKITGLDSWYSGFNGSNYAKTSDEYTGSNGQVGPNLINDHYLVDTSTAANGSSTSAIVAEACKEIASPVSNGYYPVYVDVPRGNAGYCAYHTYGSCKGTTIQVAFFFDLDGDAGCDPQDTSGLHSQGLAALANVSGHELSEARTDPDSPGAWYDKRGEENGDKCAWTFGAPLVTFSNSTQWKIQGEWSNNAYNSGTGYPNSSGQKGCLAGN
ncbi:MAG TPA: hypothetical protein VH350_20345 [Candidatus Sulfotelmatobacter sp.]|jgi:hypothetical protein|nr:hypothetical protein [Candidatus Sulfotelmatobacter sp.]